MPPDNGSDLDLRRRDRGPARERPPARSGAPTVSVIVPVYNRQRYIADALDSLRRQTFIDLEIVVVDDGSTDASAEIIGRTPDDRLRLVRHDTNQGVAAARNTGLEAARGRYIAWLDSDDIARPSRLAEQVRFLDEHPEVAMAGCCAGKIDADGARRRGVRSPPLSSAEIAAWSLFRSPFQQSSLMGRSDVLGRFSYRTDYRVCEDLDLFLRLQRAHTLVNLPMVLIDRRLHEGQLVRSHQAEIRERKLELLAEPLAQTGLRVTDEDLRRHVYLGKTKLDGAPPGDDFLGWATTWLMDLRRANARSGAIDASALRLATTWFWLLACRSELLRGSPGRNLRNLATSRLTYGALSPEALRRLRLMADIRKHGARADAFGRPVALKASAGHRQGSATPRSLRQPASKAN
jgi:glycosyltransferase involved in cell wall biosynthesis